MEDRLVRRFRLQPVSGQDGMDVELERVPATPDERYLAAVGECRVEVEVERGGRGAGRLRIGGRIAAFHAVRAGDRIWVWTAGRTFVFERVDRTAQRARAGAGTLRTDTLAAPMPGRILRINVGPGDEFDAHAALILMESMKMETTISVPAPGRVREILCEEGQLVELGERLATLEATAPGDDGEPA